MKTWRIRLAAAAVMLLIFGMVESVTFASGTIGNIARPVASGRATLGFDYENFEEEFKYEATLECPSCIPSSVTVPGKDKLKFSAPSFVGTYGLPDSPVEVGFLIGQLTIKPEGDLNLTGPKSGGFVRYAAQNPESLNFGLLLKVEGASVSSADYTGTYSAITAAFGISKDFGPAARLFGGAFGNQVDIKLDATDKILG
ncbi:MAG: hypothetical protein OEW12_05020, partial [Deltaproteobacteria bacterium]|nr:hypothetical protein [Deltaproteobacteria bacterium]